MRRTDWRGQSHGRVARFEGKEEDKQLTSPGLQCIQYKHFHQNPHQRHWSNRRLLGEEAWHVR